MITLLTDRPLSPGRLEKWGLGDVPLRHVIGADGLRGVKGPVLVPFSYTPDTYHLFRLLSQRDEPYGLLLHGTIPLMSPRYKYWLKRLSVYISDVRYADFAICAGSVSLDHPLIGTRTAIYPAMAPDCERVENLNRQPLPSFSPYALFLDEAIEMPHPDYALIGRTPPNGPTYELQMRTMFDTIERSLGMDIIIAAHPCRPLNDWRLYNQVTYYRNTPALTYHAAVVLTHCSTAVSYAVICGTPVCCVLPKCLRDRPEGSGTQAMATALNAPLIEHQGLTINSPTRIPLISHKQYDEYYRRYLTTPEAAEHHITIAKALMAYMETV